MPEIMSDELVGVGITSIIHHPLVMDVSSTPCAITDLPIIILYHTIIHVYIYIERAISTLISPTQYHPNKSPHIFISSQVPPSQIVFPLCDPIIDPHVWFFTYIEPVFVKDHHPSPCCLNQRGFLNSWWRNPLMLLTVLTVLTLLSLQHNCCPLVI